MPDTAVHILIYTFLKGSKGAKTKEVEEDNILETVYFGDAEESSDSDKERNEGRAFIYKFMYSVRVYLPRRILVLYVCLIFFISTISFGSDKSYTNCTCRTF